MGQKARVVVAALSMIAAAAGLSQFSARVRAVDIVAIFAAGALVGATITGLVVLKSLVGQDTLRPLQSSLRPQRTAARGTWGLLAQTQSGLSRT